MNFLIQIILPYILLYKYLALFVITFLSSIFLPVPAGSLLIATSAFASQGYFSFFPLVLIVILANVLGDNICYWLARLYGTKILSFFGFRKILKSPKTERVEKRIREKAGFIIFSSSVDVITSLIVNLIAGISKVSVKKFMLFEAIGVIIETCFYAGLGYLFGDSWQAINNLIGNFSIILFLALALLLFLFWKRVLRGFRKR